VTALQAVALSGLCVVALAVVLTHDPLRQAFVVGIYGFLLAITFFLFQAPDVALSEIVVATVALPVMILLALAKIREQEEEREQDQEQEAQ
jgi:energy-converting hydrogenase B subunit D